MSALSRTSQSAIGPRCFSRASAQRNCANEKLCSSTFRVTLGPNDGIKTADLEPATIRAANGILRVPRERLAGRTRTSEVSRHLRTQARLDSAGCRKRQHNPLPLGRRHLHRVRHATPPLFALNRARVCMGETLAVTERDLGFHVRRETARRCATRVSTCAARFRVRESSGRSGTGRSLSTHRRRPRARSHDCPRALGERHQVPWQPCRELREPMQRSDVSRALGEPRLIALPIFRAHERLRIAGSIGFVLPDFSIV
jgi:hypothetical protein